MHEQNSDILKRVSELARTEGLWQEGDTVVTAVSGGPDSMALLHMLAKLAELHKLTIVAAHVNHGFREASAGEAETVRRFSEELGLPFEYAVFDLPAYIVETGMNAQAAARSKRYGFLEQTAAKYGASKIALAHHGDDQAETVLMRFIRGTGPGGLAGITMKRSLRNVELIRPLLRMNKLDLLRYCEKHAVPYCIDSSNEQRYYFRNKIRMDVLPYLSQYNPRLTESLQHLSEMAHGEDEWMESQTLQQFQMIVVQRPEGYALACKDLTGLHVALQRRLIKLILNYLSQEADSISYEQIEGMRAAARPDAPSTWQADVHGGIKCVREYDLLRWQRVSAGSDRAAGFSCIVPEHGELPLPVSGYVLEALGAGDRRVAGDRFEAFFDAAELHYPLTVRSRQPGDRIQVLGLNGSKKVQDMFVDEKVPPSERDRYPLLADADGRLLWIPGIRRSAHALVGPQTKHVIGFRLRKADALDNE
ncbi:tRNA lysidine(34) synthetase TilS [Paenibacillus sp. GCM10023252]|uniref:tRNA lysidine(34) synthetase TilS n=1 Tax=Paenibacillus sp. GCM10023252 TaxID=3252649 RepID=UPI00361350EE